MNRYQAGAAHLAISAFIATAIFLPIYFVWYPGAMFESAGGRVLFLLIACVDVIVGPLITTVVYRHGKRGMKFDLAVIAILQVAALIYGVSVLFESRPVYVAFVQDRFELVRANEVAEHDLGESTPAKREPLSVMGPRLVGVRLPTDPGERFRLAVSALGGIDAQGYPQYYVPYEEVRARVRDLAPPIAKLRELNRDDALEIDRLSRRLGNEQDLGFLPMRAGKHDLAVIVSKRNGDVLAYTSLRPWEY